MLVREMEDQRRLTFRPSPDSPSALPLAVRAVGTYTLCTGHGLRRLTKNHFQLYWGIEGSGRFERGTEEYTLKPAQTFVYLPGDIHHYEAVTEKWVYCFLALDGAAIEPIVRSLGFEPHIRPARSCPQSLFEQLHLLVPQHSPENEQNASALAYEILLRATLPPEDAESDDLAAQARRIIEQNARDPRFGIEQVAEQLDVHRSTLLRQFKSALRMTPSEYLSRVRVNRALDLLQNSSKTVTEIAAESGFDDLSYFGKVIHRVTGHAPSELRQ